MDSTQTAKQQDNVSVRPGVTKSLPFLGAVWDDHRLSSGPLHILSKHLQQ